MARNADCYCDQSDSIPSFKQRGIKAITCAERELEIHTDRREEAGEQQVREGLALEPSRTSRPPPSQPVNDMELSLVWHVPEEECSLSPTYIVSLLKHISLRAMEQRKSRTTGALRQVRMLLKGHNT